MMHYFPLNKATFDITPTIPNADKSDDEGGPLITCAVLRYRLPLIFTIPLSSPPTAPLLLLTFALPYVCLKSTPRQLNFLFGF